MDTGWGGRRQEGRVEGAGWKAGDRVGRVEKGKPAQHHHNGSLTSHCFITDLLYPSLSYSLLHIPAQDSTVVAPRANALRTLKNPLGGEHQARLTSKSLCCSARLAQTPHITHFIEPKTFSSVRCNGTWLCSAAGSACCVPPRFRQLGSMHNFTLAQYRLATIPPSHLAPGEQREKVMKITAKLTVDILTVQRGRGGGADPW